MVCLSRPYRFNFFKACLRQISLGSFLHILTQIKKNIPESLNKFQKLSYINGNPMKMTYSSLLNWCMGWEGQFHWIYFD